MKYIDEYRDPALAGSLLSAIERLASRIGKDIAIMEVCGSHTTAISRYGIRKILPGNIRLVSGPGCPVCVTSIHDVDRALFLARRERTIFATFGDMLRVPGTDGDSLQKAKASGADVRVVSSALDCILLAEENKTKTVVMMGIGFETTSPTVAFAVKSALEKGTGNFCVFSVHKVVPPAIRVLIEDPSLNIDGFLCPGHVSTVIGADAYEFIAGAGKAAVITGFEPVDILEGILMILKQTAEGEKAVSLQYSRGVGPGGNPRARGVQDEVFTPETAVWRGLGEIPESGLRFRGRYKDFDALTRFSIPPIASAEVEGCQCGNILKGVRSPDECPLFKKVCTPLNPIGPCMVSSEGSCAAYHKYHSRR